MLTYSGVIIGQNPEKYVGILFTKHQYSQILVNISEFIGRSQPANSKLYPHRYIVSN
jgi:hypothetical protein